MPQARNDGQMIVAANLLTAPGPDIGRTTGPSIATPADSGTDSGDSASDALERLGNFAESAAQSRKAFAEERLKHLKEQMNTLSLFNLAPGFLTDHSARMARELESAARDFSASFKTLSNLDQAPEADAGLPSAYLDVTLDVSDSNRLTPEDAETAASFISTAQQLRSVVDMASEQSGNRFNGQRTADEARDATARVVDLIAGLEGPSRFDRIYW